MVQTLEQHSTDITQLTHSQRQTLRQLIRQSKRIVIKVGSALITKNTCGINTEIVNYLADSCHQLLDQQKEVVIVSSGAIAEGLYSMHQPERPQQLSALQALAAIGQMGLAQAYENAFAKIGRHVAQILLTHDDQLNQKRFNNAGRTIEQLLHWQVIPIINENDTIADDEIRFGDNDTLASLSANLIHADLLIILTDQEGMFTANPRVNPDAKLINEQWANLPELLKMATQEGGKLGTGGMHTKVLAARQASITATNTIIASGHQPQVIERILQGESLGTLLYSDQLHQQINQKD